MLSELKVGQIWREVDPRFNRHVEVMEIHKGEIKSVLICNIDPMTNQRGRKTWASKGRFNGKRGGYELWRRAPASEGEQK
ncbi:hypothetical protein DF026_09885 [Burkholderia stagnalis]|nr:hypothetical protein DF025_10000 [Burkholderia stagnalis]RQR22523.1 hypothetical protein DF026_09885 [Burkholderia stagnalis]